MQAVTIPSADVLSVTEVPEPAPGPGQVAIDVAYAGVNYAEILYRRGVVPVALPYVPGIEVAGRIRSVGAGVDSFGVGTRVAGLTMVDGGGYAEVAVTDARLVAPIPGEADDADLARYAATPSNTTTAFLALDDGARIRPGDRVLVHAAAGGLGSQVGQIAALLGAETVVGVVGDASKRDRAAALGYDRILLRDELAGHDGEYDLVVDPVGGAVRRRSLELLRLGGRVLAVGNASDGDDIMVGANELWFASTGVVGHNTGAWAATRPEEVGAALRRAVDAVAAGRVRVDVAATVAPTDAASAHAALERGATTGKTVLAMTPAG